MLLSDEWVNNENKKNQRSFWKQMKMNTKQPPKYGTQRKAVLRGKFIAIQAYLKKIATF